MTKRFILPLAALILCTVLLLIACGHVLSGVYQGARVARNGQLRPAVSYDEVLATILAAGNASAGNSFRNGETLADAAPAAAESGYAGDSMVKTYSAAEERASGEPDYSGTNVQVEGVDEADIVKTDGEYIYALYSNELRIYQAAGADSAYLGAAFLWGKDTGDSNRSAQEMYLFEDRVAVLCQDWNWSDSRGSESQTSLVLLDVSDPGAPEFLTTLGQDGNYRDSRLVDGVLCLISDYRVWYWYDGVEPPLYIPSVYRDGEASLLPAESIWLPEVPSDTAYTVLSAIDLRTAERLSSSTILDHTDTVYMDGDSIYLCASHYDESESEPYSQRQYTVVDHTSVSSTTVTAFDLSADGLSLRASGAVPGSLLNQFSLDARDGYLRLAVTENESSWQIFTDEEYDFVNYRWNEASQSNSLYVLDGDMQIVGSLTGLGADERIYSVRFEGDLCYFVTFRQTDPLFAADLSDPRRPVVLSELKLPGFSSYLHVYGEGLLFGLGQWADEETGWTEGLKLSMYDSTDPADLREISTLRLEEVWYSPALNDHKALLILPDKNLIGFSCDTGYLVFSFEDGAFLQRATLALIQEEYSHWDSWTSRALLIRDDLYLVSAGGLAVYDTVEFDTLCTIRK